MSILSNVIGKQGEHIFELEITDYKQFSAPLFEPVFLGDKWPTVDCYVELRGVQETTPFFFVQVKATSNVLADDAKTLEISAEKEKCERLYSIPGPTYIAGVHVPTHKAYLLSVHAQPEQGIYSIPLKNELTPDNLRLLYKEVSDFWKTFPHKPTESHFK